MSKVIDFQDSSLAIEIKRSEEFKNVAKELSDNIKALPLSQPDNDKLISLIIAQVNQAEQDAFEQGLALGIKMGRESHGTNEDR